MCDIREFISEHMKAGGALLPTDSGGLPSGLNETLTFYPEGDRDRKSSVNGAVDRANLRGTNEVRGDGVSLNRQEGRSVRSSVNIYVEATVGVRTKQPTSNPDVFKDQSGDLWAVKRMIEDLSYYNPATSAKAGIQVFLCVRRDDLTVRADARAG